MLIWNTKKLTFSYAAAEAPANVSTNQKILKLQSQFGHKATSYTEQLQAILNYMM